MTRPLMGDPQDLPFLMANHFHLLAQSNETQAEIGAVFGVDYSTVSRSRTRLKAKLKSNRKLNKQFMQIKEQIINLSI